MELWHKKHLLPWQIHPALTTESLGRVASILRLTRDSAARHARWGLNDDLWVIGCTAWKRAVGALAKASANEYHEWLSTKFVESIHLIKIKGVPLRHFKGFEDDPVPEKYRSGSPGEDMALSLTFQNLDLLTGYLRFEVSTTSKGFTKDVTFVVVGKGGERMHPWTIPQYETSVGKRRGAVRLRRSGDERDDTAGQRNREGA